MLPHTSPTSQETGLDRGEWQNLPSRSPGWFGSGYATNATAAECPCSPKCAKIADTRGVATAKSGDANDEAARARATPPGWTKMENPSPHHIERPQPPPYIGVPGLGPRSEPSSVGGCGDRAPSRCGWCGFTAGWLTLVAISTRYFALCCSPARHWGSALFFADHMSLVQGCPRPGCPAGGCSRRLLVGALPIPNGAATCSKPSCRAGALHFFPRLLAALVWPLRHFRRHFLAPWVPGHGGIVLREYPERSSVILPPGVETKPGSCEFQFPRIRRT